MDIVTLTHEDRKLMHQGPPETKESIASALEAQEVERATMLAHILATFSGYENLREQPEHIRQHFAQWGLTAVRGSALPMKFCYCALASHAAAQAASDTLATLEQYPAPDLLASHNSKEQHDWNLIALRAIEAYLGVMGGKTTDVAQQLYARRLRLVTQ